MQVANHAQGDRVVEAQGIPHGNDKVARLQRCAIPQRRLNQVQRGTCFGTDYLHNSQITQLVLSADSPLEDLASRKTDLDLGCVTDDVRVRDNHALFVYDEAAAMRLFRKRPHAWDLQGDVLCEELMQTVAILEAHVVLPVVETVQTHDGWAHLLYGLLDESGTLLPPRDRHRRGRRVGGGGCRASVTARRAGRASKELEGRGRQQLGSCGRRRGRGGGQRARGARGEEATGRGPKGGVGSGGSRGGRSGQRLSGAGLARPAPGPTHRCQRSPGARQHHQQCRTRGPGQEHRPAAAAPMALVSHFTAAHPAACAPTSDACSPASGGAQQAAALTVLRCADGRCAPVADEAA
mmetsp:Transcript_9603/g.35194  ORF Transcript_9603/g.35194 Transcript_9603/m.35194 type:complete len:351 (-) Transcript_9603:356-1408(-)